MHKKGTSEVTFHMRDKVSHEQFRRKILFDTEAKTDSGNGLNLDSRLRGIKQKNSCQG